MSDDRTLAILSWVCHECFAYNEPYYTEDWEGNEVPTVDLVCDECDHGYCSKCQKGEAGVVKKTELKLDVQKENQKGKDVKGENVKGKARAKK